MQKAILIVNLGSSSLKFSTFCIEHDQLNSIAIVRGQIAPLEATTALKAYDKNKKLIEETIQLVVDTKRCIQFIIMKFLLDWLNAHFPNYLLIGAGHRVVHGGNLFTQPMILNPKILKKLKTFNPLAPLHQPYNLMGIEIVASQLPNILQVACFDTAFHSTQSKVAQAYAIPDSVSKGLIKRYGFHGISYEYVAEALAHYVDSEIAEGKVIVAHLGNGASLCAMYQRKSIATSMGFTALDGLPMGTRCGNLDPGIVLYLIEEKKMTVPEVTKLLYHQSGLLGVSKQSSDINELIKSSHVRSKFAIDLFIYRILREIGSLMGALGGLDCLVFTGGIGEHCASIRKNICKQLKWLKIDLNVTANAVNHVKISTRGSLIPVLVIPTNEELMIASHAWDIIRAKVD